MSGRRSTPQKKIDERAFPVLVKFAIPDGGFGRRLDELHMWLRDEIGPAQYAIHSAGGIGGIDAIGIYLRDIECAEAVANAFPEFQLADGTDCISYSTRAHHAHWQGEDIFGVCNLYSMTREQDAIRQIAKIKKDKTGNMPPLPGIFPDYQAPVAFNGTEGRTLAMMRWGMPSPKFALKNRKTDSGITNVRNTKSPHWRRWLTVEHRCVVPFTSFSENRPKTATQPATPVWFSFDETRPLSFFAGIWTQWTSVRKLKEGETTNDLFAFLTTDANAEVGKIHPKAMPVILTNEDEIETWLTGETEDALALQRPLPDGSLQIVAEGEKTDGAAA